MQQSVHAAWVLLDLIVPWHVCVGECAQIAERLKKAVGAASQAEPLQNQAGATLGPASEPAQQPGYEGDVEMQA